MPDYLVFQLWGAMAAWGGIAVGEERISDDRPTRSALLGLIAAALGIPRCDDASQRELATSVGIACRVDRAGEVIRDFHTSQMPPQVALKAAPAHTRRGELLSLERRVAKTGKQEGTLVSHREYRCDACVAVAIAVRAECRWSLHSIAEGLGRPGFVTYLGRKSCPPGLPFSPRIFATETVVEALDQIKPLDDLRELTGMNPQSTRDMTSAVYCDEHLAAGCTVAALRDRRDNPVSRARWTFELRREAECRTRNGGDDVL